MKPSNTRFHRFSWDSIGRFGSVLACISLFALGVNAQSATDNGTPLGLTAGSPEGSYALSGFESVNLYNGKLSFSLPALRVGGRGSTGYTMQIPIDQHWVAVKDRWIDEFGNEQFTIYASFNGGVLPYAGNYYGPGSVDIRYAQWRSTTCPIPGMASTYTWARASIVFTAPDGTEHELVDQATLGQPREYPTCTPNGYSRGTVFVSADGAGMTFISNSQINDMTFCCPVSLGGLLKMRDGTVYRVDSISHGGPGWEYFTRIISWIRDPNGNKTTFTYTSSDWGDLLTSIKDSLNRVVNIEYGVTEAPYGLCDRLTYKGFGGPTRTIHVTKGNLSTALRPGFSQQNYEQLFPQLDGEGPFEQMMITGVWFPDTDGVTRRYRFLYNSYGELARVELPTGGAIEYDWGPGLANGATGGVMPQIPNVVHPQDNADPDIPGIYRRILSRRAYDVGNVLLGSTTYSRPETQNYDNTINNLGYVSVSHLNAAGQQLSLDKHFFYGSPARSFFSWENSPRFMPAYSPFGGSWEGKEYQTELYAADGQTLLRRSADTWAHPSVPWWYGSPEEGPPNNPYVKENISTLADSGQVTKTTHVDPQSGQVMIDQFGNFTDTWLYDYGQGTPGNLLTRSHTDYLTVNPINGVDYTNRTLASSPHMLSLATRTSVYDAGGVERSRTTFEYDNYSTDTNHAALINRAGISGLDSAYTAYYTPRGNVTGTTRYLLSDGTVAGFISSYAQYDIAGNGVKAIDARGNATIFGFADCFGIPDNEARANTAPVELSSVGQTSYAFATSATNAMGQTVYTQFDFYSGRSVNSEDANGVVASGYFNDVLDRPTKVIRGANQLNSFKSQSIFSYDDTNRIVTTTSDLNSFEEQNPLKSQTLYDGLGRTTETRQYETASNYIALRQQYDALGRVVQTSNPFRPWNGENPVWTTTAFDALSRVISVTTPDNAVVSTAYIGNSITVTDQIEKSRKSVSDALGRLMQVYEDPNGQNHITNYSYDILGNLLTVSQGAQTRTFVYDSLKRLTSATNPENGTMSFTYDNNGNLLTRIDARSITTTLAYDPLNRPTSKTYQNDPNNTPPVYFYYDSQPLPAGAPSFARGPSIGRLVATTYGANSSAGDYYGFDVIGRTALKIQQTSGINYQTTFGYNVAGAVTSETYPSGRTVNYAFDQAGRLTSFTGNLGDGVSRNYSTGIVYSPLGGMSKEQFGTSTPIYNKLWYNVRGQLSEIRESTSYGGPGDTTWNRGAIINQYATGCWACSGPDNNGNLKWQEVYIPNDEQVTTYTSWAQIYTYDSLNRLTQVNEDTGNPSLDWQQKYIIDRYGNRTIDVNNTSANIPRPAFNVDVNTNRLTVPGGQTGVMSYDNAGNLITDSYTGAGGRTYDAENRMIAAQGTQWSYYTYDASGQRVRRNVNGQETWQVYGLAGELLAEYAANSPASTPWKEYGYRNGQLLVTVENSVGNVSWTNAVGVTVSNNSLTKNVKGTWNAGAVSQQTIASGDGYMEFTASETYTQRRAGLSYGNTNQNWDDIDFCIFLSSDGTVSINEGATLRGAFGTYVSGDRFRVGVENGVVKYRKNGTLLYTSTITPTYPLLVDTSLNTLGSTITNVILGPVVTQWLVVDQLGTPRMVFDQGGSLAKVSRHDYLPFGEELGVGQGLRSTSLGFAVNDGVRQHFTGYERDGESGLDYARARYYSSGQGRFTGVDPVGGRPKTPQTWNRYAYTGNNPLKFVDPSGMNYFIGESGALDPFIPEFRIDGFTVGPEGTNSRIEESSFADTYEPNEFLLNEGMVQPTDGADSSEESAGDDDTDVIRIDSEPAYLPTVYVWNGQWRFLLGGNWQSTFGHVSYSYGPDMRSWEGEGWADRLPTGGYRLPTVEEFIRRNSYRTADVYVFNFGPSRNRLWWSRIQSSYDGIAVGMGVGSSKSSGYDLFQNNCAAAFCRTAEAMGFPQVKEMSPSYLKGYINANMKQYLKRHYTIP